MDSAEKIKFVEHLSEDTKLEFLEDLSVFELFLFIIFRPRTPETCRTLEWACRLEPCDQRLNRVQ